MARFRIHRMKDAARQQFRWAPHVSGAASIKARDFEVSIEADADNEYALWALLRESENALGVGDVLETESGALRICKYVGFEDARWFVPETHGQESLVPNASVAELAPAAI